MTTIIGSINTESKQIALFSKAVTRPAQVDDIIMAGGEFWRVIWNHNGQRFTTVNITSVMVEAWERSEAEREAARLAPKVRAALVEPLAALVSQRNTASEAVQ